MASGFSFPSASRGGVVLASEIFKNEVIDS